MNHIAFGRSTAHDSAEAGMELASMLRDKLEGRQAHAVVVFASSRHSYAELLKPLLSEIQPDHLIGCSSAGEFVEASMGEGSTCALAFHSDEIIFSSAVGSNLSSEPRKAAQSLVDEMVGMREDASSQKFRTALVFCDALAGNTEVLIDELTRLTAGNYQLVGGGAGDDANFSKTHVFFRDQVQSDSVVLLEMLSDKPIGIGVSHGWEPTGQLMRVTAAEGFTLGSLNAEPAAEIFQRHADETDQDFDRSEPVPFFLHNVIGIKTPVGWKLRVPLSINEDGSILCASEIPLGATLSFMRATPESSARAAEHAIAKAMDQMGGSPPGAALFFDCVATRLRMGTGFGLELESIKKALNGVSFAGYNTYGQIARSDSQFSGFHNCTAVVCLLPA